MAEAMTRLDQWLVMNHQARSRAQAVELIRSGAVWIDGKVETQVARKLSPEVKPELKIEIRIPSDNILLNSHQFVSRAAIKLQAGLAHFAIDPRNRIAVDLGTSTGGFSQVLLQAGVKKIYGIEIGSGQLAAILQSEPRLELREKTNARSLLPSDFAEPIELVVADLSFISLSLALPPILSIATMGAEAVVLIKPQFEVGRDSIAKNGIVKDQTAIAAALKKVEMVFIELGWIILGIIPSPILGGSGNAEYLLAARLITRP